MPDGSHPLSHTSSTAAVQTRHVWTVEELQALLNLPLPDLMFQAQTLHRATLAPTSIQTPTLLSINTACSPEVSA